jgi:hypothetical protein
MVIWYICWLIGTYVCTSLGKYFLEKSGNPGQAANKTRLRNFFSAKRFSNQGDRMSLRKKSPKMQPKPFFVRKSFKNVFLVDKRAQKIWATATIFKTLPPSKPLPIGRKICPIWDRCYDFLNIFDKKISEKIGVFDSK